MGTPRNNARTAICAERVFDGLRWHSGTGVVLDGNRVAGLFPLEHVPGDCQQHCLPAGTFLTPGFVDLQVNGGGGVLLNDEPTPEAMQAIARAHRPFGTTACLPTFITDTREKTERAIAAAIAAAGQDGVLGLHLEGPFINPARVGVHRPDRILQAELSDLDWLGEVGKAGRSLVTLAPECVPPGFIRGLTERGIRVAIGHSAATAEDVTCAVDEGATAVTHLFNAMPPFAGRAPSIIGSAFADSTLIAGLIVDGLHVDPISVRAAFAAKGADAIALVTDAMPTVGAKIGQFDLMERTIFLRDGKLVTEDGTLAGAHLDMASAVRNAVFSCGIRLEDALGAASHTPARLLGLEGERGLLVPGAFADLVALTDDLRVHAVWAAGIATQS